MFTQSIFSNATPSSYGKEPSALLCADKPAVVATDARLASAPCPGESADDNVERIHSLSLWPLAKAAAFGQRPKGSVKPTALSPGQGDERNEVKRRGCR